MIGMYPELFTHVCGSCSIDDPGRTVKPLPGFRIHILIPQPHAVSCTALKTHFSHYWSDYFKYLLALGQQYFGSRRKWFLPLFIRMKL